MQIDKNRFFSMAEAYDKMCRFLVPGYDFLQNDLVDMMVFEGIEEPVAVDLGAGSGYLLERILTRFPEARGFYFDYSKDFLRVAEKRLARFGARIEMHQASFFDDWEGKLIRPPDTIASMSAIHHLESPGKRKLYAKCFDALASGGWLYNIDEMKTFQEGSYVKSLRFWVRFVESAGSSIPSELIPYYGQWMERFRSWKERNVDRLGEPKREGDDIHEPFADQMHWLEEIGFCDVDLFTKYHLWCTIGGRKPG